MAEETKAHLLLIHAETPMHPGTGSALGIVDLPVARERHTQFPYIAGSSLKGVLRDAARPAKGEDGKQWTTVFGPETANASDFAGALSITDARLLAMPLRSLAGLFAWVTCPAVLDRLVRDAKLAGAGTLLSTPADNLLQKVRNGAEGSAFVAKDSPLLVSGSAVVLEEFDYAAAPLPEVKAFGEALSKALGGGSELRFATHLAVIHDDAFSFAARHATEVMARIGIDSATKTVKDGALFYEEFLPAGTVLYAVALADTPRSKEEDRGGLSGAQGVLGHLAKVLAGKHNLLQIGGNATTGKGLSTVVLEGGAR